MHKSEEDIVEASKSPTRGTRAISKSFSAPVVPEPQTSAILLKKERGIIRSTWKERSVLLLDGSLFFYQAAEDLTPRGVYHLLHCQVSESIEEKSKRKHAFCLHTPSDGEVYFAATDEQEKKLWLELIARGRREKPADAPPIKGWKPKNQDSDKVYFNRPLLESLLRLGRKGKVVRKFLSNDAISALEAIKNFLIQYLGGEEAEMIEMNFLSFLSETITRFQLTKKDKRIYAREYLKNALVPLKKLVSTAIDGYEIPFSFSPHEMVDMMKELEGILVKLLGPPMLHSKSIEKMRKVFRALEDATLIGEFYEKKKWKECEILAEVLRNVWDSDLLD